MRSLRLLGPPTRARGGLALLVLCTVLDVGCAATAYHHNSYTGTLPGDASAGDLPDGTEVVARFVDDYEAEVLKLYADGYQLVGFAKFTSALAPRFAERDARITAKKRGATLALMRQPESAKLNQTSYVTSFWRPMPEGRFLLGAYYADLSPPVLGAVGCQHNVVALGFVVGGTPAAAMGLAEEDVIVFLDDQRITDARSLDEALLARAGRSVEVKYVRDGERRSATGTLGPRDVAPESLPGPPGFGLLLVQGPAEDALRAAVGRDAGVFVDGVLYDSPACESGMRTSDFLLSVDGESIGDLDDARQAFADAEGPTRLTVVRGLKRQEVVLERGVVGSDGSRARLDLQEASLRMPWDAAQGRDWTWLTASAMAMSNAAGQYAQYVESERVRIEEYNRAQARAALVESPVVVVGTGRSGSSFVQTRSGDMLSVNRETARMIQDNPGYYVQTGRRGAMEIYDEDGRRVDIPAPTVTGSAPSLELNFGDSLKDFYRQVPPNGLYGPDWLGSAR